MGDKWIENTMRWLEKKAKEKAISKKESLKGKFNKLNAEKKLMEELFQTNEVTNLNEVNSGNLSKKVIYNNSSKILSSKQQKVLELGLNFAITQKTFPLLGYIANLLRKPK